MLLYKISSYSNIIMFRVAEFISTICYIGKIKYAPGTFGSLLAFPLMYLVSYLIFENSYILFTDSFVTIEEAQIVTFIIFSIAIALLLFILGTITSQIYIKYINKDDPSEVVIDELVGQMLVIICSPLSVGIIYQTMLAKLLPTIFLDIITLLILPFILFRLFDITKPWPINYIDQKVKGGFGIMLDDVLAAIFAIVVYYVIIFLILDLFPL